MKHYHNKSDLADTDVSYIVVHEGQKLKLQFTKVENKLGDIEIFQGVKFWLNRCELIYDSKLVETQVIIWPFQEYKKSKVANGHFHIYCPHEINLAVGKTTEENPNLGIFNVWTWDKKRCYEFAEKSWIKETKKNNVRYYSARHGWAQENKPTLEFTITLTEG